MAKPWVFVLSIPGVNRLEFQVQLGVHAKGWSFELLFLALHDGRCSGHCCCCRGVWGEQQGMGVCLQLPLSHLNERTFFFRGKEAVNTFPNKR